MPTQNGREPFRVTWVLYELSRLRIGFIHKLCFLLDLEKDSTEISAIVDLSNV